MREAWAPLFILVMPTLGAVILTLLSPRRAEFARFLTMTLMLIVAAISLQIFFAYDATTDAARYDFNIPWMPSLGVRLHVGVDGFNIFPLLLGAVLFPVVLGCSWNSAETRRPLYLALLLVLETSLLGTFLAQNLVLFFVFWETVLIPMGLLILAFGGRERYSASMGFFLYTLAGSVLLLAAVIALGAEALRQTGSWSFELDVLFGLQLSPPLQLFVFISIVLACAVKCPIVPFHSWLVPAYYEAPPSGSALMAGALSKMGALGMLKLALPLAPEASVTAAPYMVTLAVITILYGAVLALQQQNYKKLVAYSSLSHMGFIVLGIFSLTPASINGAMLQMLSHAMAAAGVFLLLGMLEQRHGGAWLRTSGLANVAPRYSVALMLFVLASLALPLTSGFTAEFLILFGAFRHGLDAWQAGAGALLITLAVLASLGMVLGATYMLRLARALLFDRRDDAKPVADLRMGEMLPLAAPLVLIFWIGVAPAPIMERTQGAVSMLTAEIGCTHDCTRASSDMRIVKADDRSTSGVPHDR